MTSKPPSQPTSHRSRKSEGVPADGAQAFVDEPAAAGGAVDDGTMSESSQDAVELLTKNIIRRGLADIQRSSDKKNFAYTRLELAGQNIKNLDGDIATYPSVIYEIKPSSHFVGFVPHFLSAASLFLNSEIRYLNLSNNEIMELSPLAVLPSLLSLNASQNHIHHIDSFLASPHNHLQLLQLDQNEIEYVLSSANSGSSSGSKKVSKSSLAQNFPQLFALTLSNNKLTSILRMEDSLSDFIPHQRLTVLDLSFNSLTSLEGLSLLPGLKVLNLASNALERLEGVRDLKQLEKLNVSENKLQSLFVELNRLASLPLLTALVITQGNAAFVEELEQAAAAAAALNPDSIQQPVDMPSEILILLPRLILLDGRKVTIDARRAADTLKKDRATEAERRLAEEEEAKKLLAEEEAAEAKRKKEEEEEEEKEKEKEEKDEEDEDEEKDDEKDAEKDEFDEKDDELQASTEEVDQTTEQEDQPSTEADTAGEGDEGTGGESTDTAEQEQEPEPEPAATDDAGESFEEGSEAEQGEDDDEEA